MSQEYAEQLAAKFESVEVPEAAMAEGEVAEARFFDFDVRKWAATFLAKIMEFLADNAGEVITREVFLESVKSAIAIAKASRPLLAFVLNDRVVANILTAAGNAYDSLFPRTEV